MDSLPRKVRIVCHVEKSVTCPCITKKLVEYELNKAQPKNPKIFKPTLNNEKNEGRISHKIQKVSCTPEVLNEDESLFSASPKKSSEKLEILPQLWEEEIKIQDDEEKISTGKTIIDNEKNKQLNVNNDNDGNDTLWFCTDYVEDIIGYEIYKESLYVLSESFCKKYDINPAGREILIDWLISVQVYVKAENSVLHLAVALLDIVLDRVHIPLDELQAAAVAAFWVSYKYVHGSLSMKTLLSLCKGSVSKEMIQENEMLVLKSSRLIQAGGSTTVFYNYILHQIFGFKFPPELYYCGLYLIEIMLLQFNFVDCKTYEKATTAVFTSLCLFGCPKPIDLFDTTKFITKRRLRLLYCRLMRSLRCMYNDKSALKESSVYRKYKSSRYYKISTHQKFKRLATS